MHLEDLAVTPLHHLPHRWDKAAVVIQHQVAPLVVCIRTFFWTVFDMSWTSIATDLTCFLDDTPRPQADSPRRRNGDSSTPPPSQLGQSGGRGRAPSGFAVAPQVAASSRGRGGDRRGRGGGRRSGGSVVSSRGMYLRITWLLLMVRFFFVYMCFRHVFIVNDEWCRVV